MTAQSTTARKPAARPTTPAAAKLTSVPAPKPQAPAAAKPAPAPAKPKATFDVGLKQVPAWFPVVTLADGTELRCGHAKYGHESAKASAACARSLIAKHGHVVG